MSQEEERNSQQGPCLLSQIDKLIHIYI